MPRRRDPQATRERILDAAERLFVERGFSATSIDAVATAARVGKGLVMHHAGSKAKLWAEVKRRRFATYAQGQEAALRGEAATPGLLDRSLRAYFHWLRDNRGFLRLVMWRDLERRQRLSAPEEALIALGCQRMREARDAGWFRADLDPELVLFAVFAMLENWFASGKRGCFSAADDDAYLDTVLSLLRGGLLAAAGRPA